MRLSLALTALAVSGILAGCPNGGNRLPDGGVIALDLVGRACNVDAECKASDAGVDLRCDPVRRVCICLSDLDCNRNPEAPVRFCNNYTGLCVANVAGCKSNADCEASEYCDPSIRACQPVKTFCEQCATDEECGGAGDDCVLDPNLNQKFCATACETKSDCPRGGECRDFGGKKLCGPPTQVDTEGNIPSCLSFESCTPDTLQTCNSDAECTQSEGQRCDTSQGRCIALERKCPFGTACDPTAKICVTECSIDEDCGDSNQRCINRVCEAPFSCEEDSDCSASRVCSKAPGQTVGQCRPFCQSDAECPLATICSESADGRSRCVEGCRPCDPSMATCGPRDGNRGCPIESRCGAAGLCEYAPEGEPSYCQSSSACDTCESCNLSPNLGEQFRCRSARLSFPYCERCATPTECGGGGTCVQLVDGLTYCMRQCGGGQECPQGFVCQTTNQTTADGGVLSACVPSDRSCKTPTGESKCL